MQVHQAKACQAIQEKRTDQRIGTNTEKSCIFRKNSISKILNSQFR